MTKTGRQPWLSTGTLVLSVVGLCILAIYIFLAAIPFSILKIGETPLLSFATMTGQTKAGVVRYLLTLGVPFLLYAGGFLAFRRRVPKEIIFAFPVLFGLAFLLVYPLTAGDVFLYGAQGWILLHHGANPLLVPAAAFPENPFLPWTAFTGEPSTYGPLWLYLSAVPNMFSGDQPLAALVGFKLMGLAALLGSLVLVYAIGERLRSRSGPIAAYTLGWNPLVLWATVANGHNDMVMTVLILLSVYFLLERPALALPVLVMAGLIKWAAFLLLPVFVVYLWRRGYPRLRLAGALALAAVAGALIMAPLWAGSETLAGLRNQMQNMITMSPAAAVRFLAIGEGVAPDAAERLVHDGLYAVFAVTYGAILFGVFKKRESVIAASLLALLALLMLVTFWFRFWYIVWPLAIAAVLTGTHKWLAAAGIAFSGTGLFIYLFTDYLWVWFGTDLKLHMILMAAVFAPPLAVLVLGAGVQWVRLGRRREVHQVKRGIQGSARGRNPGAERGA